MMNSCKYGANLVMLLVGMGLLMGRCLAGLELMITV